MKKIKLLSLILLFELGVRAQITEHLALDSLISKAEATYPDILRYESSIHASQAKAEGARAWMPPVVGAGIQGFPYSFHGITEQTPMNEAAVMFSVQQMIPNISRLNALKDYYNSLSDVDRNKAEWTKNELRTVAKILYYQRYASEKKLKIIRESEQLLQLFISTSESRYAYNQAELSNIYKAKAKLEEIRNMRLMEESMIAESNIGMNTLLNRPLNTAFTIDTALAPKNYSPALETGDQRTDILAMQSMIISMSKEQEYMTRFSRPEFGVQFQHMSMLRQHQTFSLMGMVTVPIVPWSSKMYKSDVKAMNFKIEEMQKDVESMQLMANRMATEKLSTLNYTQRQLDNFSKAVIPSFEKNLDVNFLAYRENKGDFFVLIDAWEMLLMKKMDEQDLVLKTLKLQAEYEREIEKK